MALLAETSGSKSQNQKWFSSDLAPSNDGMIQIHLAIAEGAATDEFQYTVDGGTNWVKYGVGSGGGQPSAAANAGIVVEMPISRTSRFNIRCTATGNRTVLFCQVHAPLLNL